MTDPRHAFCTIVVAAAVLLAAGDALRAQAADRKKPSVSLKANPPIGFNPLRVRVVAELRKGSDNHPDFYCASVEWDWGDGTVSESSSDCDPYDAEKSTIQRRYAAEHVYRQGGAYRILFKLKQKTKQVGGATTAIQVRSGPGEEFGG